MKKINILYLVFFLHVSLPSEGNNKQTKELANENFELIVKKIQYLNYKERIYTIKSLDKLSQNDKKRFFPILADISIQDRDPMIQEVSLNFLSENLADCEICKEAYKKNLYHPEEKVKLAALKGIENLKIKELEKEFLELLKQADFTQNSIFLGALIRTLGILEYNQKEISNFLKEKYNDETTNKEIKRILLLYAGNSKNIDFLEIIETALDNREDMYLQGYAINAIGKLQNQISLEQQKQLKEKLKKMYNEISNHPDPKERAKFNLLKQQILLTLIRLKDEALKEEIKTMALDDDANIRKKALEYIEELELKEFKDLLEIKYKYDSSKSVKKEAERILKKWNYL
ncbi:MAG: HEAT repeat domain-containing protein [Leptonema sp. (in: bacteria)]